MLSLEVLSALHYLAAGLGVLIVIGIGGMLRRRQMSSTAA
jgi:hypothetical protein